MHLVDVAWVLFSASLVLFMVCGLAFFYAGLVSSRNVINTINMSFICLALIPITWVILGYSLAFSGESPWIGNFDEFGLINLSRSFHDGDIPDYVYMVFQMMFACISPALISGAVVERIRFNAYMVFVVIWSILVYSTVAHWVWSDLGWLKSLGVIDFAGGMVVHLTAGCSALVAAIMMKPRKNQQKNTKLQHTPFVILGASILWYGWFGFNSGSALGMNMIAITAFVNTALGASSAILMWVVLSILMGKNISVIGIAVSSVIGLVAITPACGYVTHISSLYIGAAAAFICFFALEYRPLWAGKIDDTLDVFVFHGIAAIVGSLLTGVFCLSEVNPSIESGVITGNFDILGAQVVGVIAIALFSMCMTYLIFKAIGIFMYIRIKADDENLELGSLEHEE